MARRAGILMFFWMLLSASGSTDISQNDASVALLGHWSCEDRADGARLLTGKTFAANGQAQVDFHLDYSAAGRDDVMAMTMTGHWRLEDGILVEQGVAFEFQTLRVAGADMLGSELETALTAEMRREAARSQVLELTSERLVLSPVGASDRLICQRAR